MMTPEEFQEYHERMRMQALERSLDTVPGARAAQNARVVRRSIEVFLTARDNLREAQASPELRQSASPDHPEAHLDACARDYHDAFIALQTAAHELVEALDYDPDEGRGGSTQQVE